MKQYQSGGLLVEALLSLVIGAFIVIAVLGVTSANKRIYSVIEQSSSIQNRERFVRDVIGYDFRMAGHFGCRTADSGGNIKQLSKDTSLFGDDVIGFESGEGWTNPTNIDRVEGTDVVTVRYLESVPGLSLIGDLEKSQSAIVVTANPTGIAAGEVIAIGDCVNVDVLSATSVTDSEGTVSIAHGTGLNVSAKLSKAYTKDATVMLFVEHTYFIGVNAEGDTALYLIKNNASTAVALAESVADMQLTYTADIDSDLTPDVIVTADNIRDWDKVTGINAAFLLETKTGVAITSKAYEFVEKETNTNSDTKGRWGFWITVGLRNRLS